MLERRAYLDEIAQLVRGPESAVVRGGTRTSSVGEGVGDHAIILHLADHIAGIPPYPGDAPAAVGEAVGGDLAEGEHEVIEP